MGISKDVAHLLRKCLAGVYGHYPFDMYFIYDPAQNFMTIAQLQIEYTQ